MTSKSELKRRATLDPFWAAERIYELEQALIVLGEREVKAQMEIIEYEKLVEQDVVLMAREKARTLLAKIRGEK